MDDQAISLIWKKFLESKGLDPSGDQPLPDSWDTKTFYREWEKFLLASAVQTPGGPIGDGTVGGGEPLKDPSKGVLFYEHDNYGGTEWGPFSPGRYRNPEAAGIITLLLGGLLRHRAFLFSVKTDLSKFPELIFSSKKTGKFS